jgi:rfaE bifunctional protein kinase chain/domain
MMREMDQALARIKKDCPADGRVVFLSGNFNIVHPGHLRLLNFAAECGDYLVVGVHPDGFGDTLLPEDLRLEGVKSIGIVDHAFILRVPPEDFIRRLQPAIVVKGREHETATNPELPVVESYGGKLLFSSGDVRFSSMDLLQRELRETNFSTIVKPLDFPTRHGFDIGTIATIIGQFQKLRVVVVGDLIVDEYVNCEPLGMSQEDPTLVVMPIQTDRFLGGAGIVAAHAAGLGARVNYFAVTGDDEPAAYAASMLKKYNIDHDFARDISRPTTLKQRFRANGKTLLRVSQLRQHDASAEIARKLAEKVMQVLPGADLLVFSDFNYGCLPQILVDEITAYCKANGVMVVADSQASSQIGDVSRFKGATLMTPTEHEARLAVRDFRSGLVVLAETLRKNADAEQLLITMGAEGLLVHAPKLGDGTLMTDRLPAFNTSPKDVAGAGDCLLTSASMALAVGANIWQAAYLGSIAAACQVSRVGNLPLRAADILTELSI